MKPLVILLFFIIIFLFMPKKLNDIIKGDLFKGTQGKGIGSFCKINETDPQFVITLNKMNEELIPQGINLKNRINSGFRCLDYNRFLASVGFSTSDTSSHIKGIAVDVRANKEEAKKIIAAGQKFGVKRFIHDSKNNFIHFDTDRNKTNLIRFT